MGLSQLLVTMNANDQKIDNQKQITTKNSDKIKYQLKPIDAYLLLSLERCMIIRRDVRYSLLTDRLLSDPSGDRVGCFSSRTAITSSISEELLIYLLDVFILLDN